jgi:arylsulfatase A-like enzyme
MKSTQPGGGAGDRGIVSATYFLLLFVVFCLVIRVFDTIDLAAADALPLHPLGPPFSLPFILGGELLVGGALAAVLALLWRWRPARIAWIGVLAVYMIWLAAEQAAYQYFFSHVDYVLFSESHDLGNLSSSIAEALDAFFFAGLALAAAVAVLLLLPWRPRAVLGLVAAVRRHPARWIAGIAAYVAISLSLAALHDQQNLACPFPVAYLSSYAEHVSQERELDAAYDADDALPAKEPLVGTDGSAGAPRAARRDAAHEPRRLNVVIFLMESTSYRETSMFPGAAYDTTPFVSRLARESLFFDNYYAVVAASTRSFFSLLTGVYPYMDRASDLTKYSQIRIPSLPDVLHEEGYATAFFASSDSMFEGLDTFVSARAFDTYMDKNLVPAEELPEGGGAYWGVDEEIMIDKALAWIEQTRGSGRPFYLSYNAVFPHHPFRVPAGHADLTAMDWGGPETRARFRASLAYADRSVERLYRGLERLGLAEDTLFIITPDHGETFGDVHRKNFIHAEYCYDEDSRIFLLARNPGAIGPPRVSSELGSHLDLFPTVLEILGIERELDIDGRSLLSQGPPRILYHFSRRQIAARDGRLKLIVSRESGGGRPELYDLAADPEEQVNLADDRPDDVKRYRGLLEEWRVSVAKAFRRRLAQSGVEEREHSAIAQRRRAEMFSSTQVKLGSFTVCPGAGNTSCAPATAGTFRLGQPFTVRAVLAKPADGRVKVEIFDRNGKRAFAQIEDLVSRREATFPAIPTGALTPGERYRLRLSTVYYRAVHDSRWFQLTVQ